MSMARQGMHRALTTAVVVVVLLASATAHAQEPTAGSGEDKWVVSATLYAWAFSLDGKGAVRGNEFDVDVSFSDILDDLSFAAMGTVAARKGRFGFYVSPLFGRVEVDTEIGPFEFRTRQDTTFLGFGGLYQLIDWRRPEAATTAPESFALEAYGGGRLVDLRLEVNGRHGLPKNDKSETWVDPIVGLGGRTQLTERLELFGSADIGGFGIGSDFTWQWIAGGGYRFDLLGRETFFRAGWRMLSIDYEDGGFKWDVTYSGPILGLTMRF
jgi:hypothetical protein